MTDEQIDLAADNALWSRRITPAQSRRWKALLPGTWAWDDHQLLIGAEGDWELSCPDDVRLPRFVWLSTTRGKWGYRGGAITFHEAGPACIFVHILELDKQHLKAHFDPEPVTFTRISGS